ncbi:MAG: SAM-dependent methyltransferase [Deltaproteobacteria bacterium]|nr:SAM-dependent methyltransferase [Deltaproteobacteria bacterium]
MSNVREVHHGDGIAFLERGPLPDDHAIITSLPDHSELPKLGVDGWRRWFVETVALVCKTVDVAVFYQTDVKHDGRWIDKGHLVMCGADAAGSHVLVHKIVCRVPPGTTTFGRPAYAHLIALSRTQRLSPGASTPDVLPSLGTMTWSRAMGAAACEVAVKLVASLGAKVVVDPFCGLGSALAAANAHGLEAIGVELSRRRAAGARKATHVLDDVRQRRET